jgi:hypothetical protein
MIFSTYKDQLRSHCPPMAPWSCKPLKTKRQFWRREWIRTLPPPLDSVSCRFHVAANAIDASDAVASCPLLPAQMSRRMNHECLKSAGSSALHCSFNSSIEFDERCRRAASQQSQCAPTLRAIVAIDVGYVRDAVEFTRRSGPTRASADTRAAPHAPRVEAAGPSSPRQLMRPAAEGQGARPRAHV